ncbi:MAG: hemin uptake protein HemP [Maritimibacter sp.]
MNMMVTNTERTSGEPPCPLHHARDLTGNGPIAKIMLGDALYTLRITRQGKLILTK